MDEEKYDKDLDLKELLDNSKINLTDKQKKNFDKIMMFYNNSDSASKVDISGEVDKRIREIEKKGSFWK
jgi:hypothetical protein